MSYNDIQSTIDIHSGNIYLADLGENIGDELSGNFSVLVFQGNDNYLNNSSLVFVIPIVTKTESKPYQIYFNEFDLILNEGLSEGVILINQSRVISKKRLLDFQGRLNHKKMLDIGDLFIEFIIKNTPHI